MAETFRHSAGFEKRMEQWIFGWMLKEFLDVYFKARTTIVVGLSTGLLAISYATAAIFLSARVAEFTDA
jgi:hypothetical protein